MGMDDGTSSWWLYGDGTWTRHARDWPTAHRCLDVQPLLIMDQSRGRISWMANHKPESRLIKAAGGVAWRPGRDGEPEILLVHRRSTTTGRCPRARPSRASRSRSPPSARCSKRAARAWPSAAASLGPLQRGRPPQARALLGGARASVDDRAVPNYEVDESRGWPPPARWSGSATRTTRGARRFRPAAPRTVPVILLRHAKAVAKAGGSAPTTAARSTTRAAPTPRPWPTCSRASPRAPRLITFARRSLRGNPPPVRGAVRRPCCGKSRRSTFTTSHPERTRATLSTPLPPSWPEAVEAGEPTIFCAHRENIPVLQAAALAALGLAQPASDAAPGSALAERSWPAPPTRHSPTSPRSGTTPSPPPASGSST